MKRQVKSGFGRYRVENDWSDVDWNNYQFNLELRKSVQMKAVDERRKLNRDERDFINELETMNNTIRESNNPPTPNKRSE